ncbi:unnamed protein product [Rangifer tarandus platyrhynchus]|uniref:Uncharacterized protein n=2 Tax=Rangifer tarandus platyrhynchus TaxID=3082113 RepID=A0ABN8Y911_RANTA|nr:unnamed protein product [Rangifer tarandus platyrhynchus]
MCIHIETFYIHTETLPEGINDCGGLVNRKLQAGDPEEELQSRTSLIAQLVKNMPAMQETQLQFLGWEDPVEKEMATHSSILAWRIPWAEEPGRLQSMGSQE